MKNPTFPEILFRIADTNCTVSFVQNDEELFIKKRNSLYQPFHIWVCATQHEGCGQDSILHFQPGSPSSSLSSIPPCPVSVQPQLHRAVRQAGGDCPQVGVPGPAHSPGEHHGEAGAAEKLAETENWDCSSPERSKVPGGGWRKQNSESKKLWEQNV